jgi:prepilin-type N-terminal cleavage/methylation domain-containing protein
MNKTTNQYNEGNADNPSAFRGASKIHGLTLVELLIVVVIIAILFGLIIPAGRDHGRAKQMACESNLKQIGIAFRTWDGDYNNLYPMGYFTNQDGTKKSEFTANPYRYFQVMSNELYNPKVLICPSDDRMFATDFEHMSNNNASYFVGLDADETRPTLLLSGDRNLVTNGVDVLPGVVVIRTNDAVAWSTKMHNQTGDFGLADGSVQRGSGGSLQSYLIHTGTNMTRLAVP